ncbi:MAG: transketolase C-terminal domain-containing protein, partial [bacterium]
KKGHGYEFSESCPDKFHFTNPFILESGKIETPSARPTYSQSMASELIELAENDKKIIGVNAAMPSGTGLDAFARRFPEQFFDVGIAESHAVVFAAGLALQGFKPVVAIYSSFLQRAYDQIMHDVCLQNAPIVIAVDRGGIVGSDGPTHHGLLDLSYLRTLPNLVVLAPRDEFELQKMLNYAVKYKKGPIAMRYPRATGMGKNAIITENFNPIKAEKLVEGDDVAIIAIGTTVYTALEAAKILKKEGICATVYDVKSIKPIDKSMIIDVAKIGKVITIEENVLDGGFGSAILEEFEKNNLYNIKIRRIGIDGFVEHGEIDELKMKYGLSVENIIKNAKEIL